MKARLLSGAPALALLRRRQHATQTPQGFRHHAVPALPAMIGNPADPGPLAKLRDRIADGLTASLEFVDDDSIMDDILPTNNQNTDK